MVVQCGEGRPRNWGRSARRQGMVVQCGEGRPRNWGRSARRHVPEHSAWRRHYVCKVGGVAPVVWG
eukprot:362121-Chlamydomonas_euryale.AAC.3